MRKSRSEQLRYKALEQRVYDQIAAAGPLYKVNIQLLLRDYQIDEALHALMERGRIIRFSDERYALPGTPEPSSHDKSVVWYARELILDIPNAEPVLIDGIGRDLPLHRSKPR